MSGDVSTASVPLYGVIVIDPPWKQMGGSLKGGVGENFVFDGNPRSQPLPYPTMSLGAIADLPVDLYADENCALYLWVTNHYLPDAFELVRGWGFRYSTTIVWTKAPIGKGLGGAWGISTEFVLYARKGSPVEKTKHGSTWYGWKRPYDKRGKPKHSAKSPALQDLIEELHDGPYLEMFAREQRLGWDTYGNQALNHLEAVSGL